jgi:hypothetical protein
VHLAEPIKDIYDLLKEEQTSDNRLKSWIYAVGIAVDINPSASGQWDTIPGVGYVWRIGIHADRALSLNLLLENLQMQAGESLYVYDEAQSVVSSFNARNHSRIQPIESVSGHSLVVEWNIPVRSPWQAFRITSVGYGFRDAHSDGIVSLAAGKCNVDINCKSGNHWQREKRSVVRLQTTYKNKSGKTVTQSCSGVLVNQADKEKKPYILTAGHCVGTDEMASGTVFNFEYEKISCDDESTPIASKNISGSTLLAFKTELDFALLELSMDIPDAYRPFYAGWNLSSNAPISGTGIHHPSGDVKKIAVEKAPPISATYDDGVLRCDYDTHWQIKRWDEGATEEGSSGSPLFDANHLLVGTLTGGDAKCSNPVNDYYSKINQQWSRYGKDDERLKTWLDPKYTGVTMLPGYDPFTKFEAVCDTLSHIGHNEPTTLIASEKWGVLTGHNDKYWTGFAELFRNDTVATIIGIETDIFKVFDEGSRVRFSIWSGSEYPLVERWGKDMLLSEEYHDFPLQIYLDGTLELRGDFFIGFSIDYSPVDTFAVYQSVRRPYEGISSLYVNDGGSWKPLSEETPPIFASLAIKAIGQFGKTVDKPIADFSYQEMKVVFHPNNDIIFAYFENPAGTVSVECFDMSGRRVQVNEIGRHLVMPTENIYLQIEINSNNLPYGMYILRIKDRDKVHTGKFIRM